jgi:acetyltransferase
MKLRHYLQPLVTPTSVALIGASERPGSTGRIVFENVLAGGFSGDVVAVNPNRRKILGHDAARSLAAVKQRIDCAVIATPCDQVADVLAQGGAAGLRSAVILTAPPVGATAAARWSREIATVAAAHRIRFLGPEAFGVIRTDFGLNATVGSVQALPGRLALIAQSGAVCSALLDFATPAGIGFSSVVALGGALDVSFGELLDALLLDPGTDAIVLHVEALRDPRRFLSALRTAARTKPVVVLKTGRAVDLSDGHHAAAAPAEDTVFDAALKRAGTVRVHSYTQLFAAARILAMGRTVAGDRLAVVTNGRGPGLMAADSSIDCDVRLASFTPETMARLDALLPPESPRDNPLDIGGTATPRRIGEALSCVLQDENTDAVLALHVPLPAAPATDAARAVADAVRAHPRKLTLSAWMGAIQKKEARQALEAGGVADFFTPENAVEAFSFLAAYGRNQKWLLEVPPPQPEPEPLDLAAAERVRERALAASRTILSDPEAYALLSAFSLPAPATAVASTRAGAVGAARRIGFPVALKLQSQVVAHPHQVARSRLNLRNASMVARAYDTLLQEARERAGTPWIYGVAVQKMIALPHAREVAIGVYTDRVFGPVITFGNGGVNAAVEREKAVMLPPLNRALALDLISGTRTAKYLGAYRELPAADLEPLVKMLLQLSTLVCALPWVRELELNPVQVTPTGAAIVDARITVDPQRRAVPDGYRHMAIHPYPIELVGDATLRDGTVLHVRPIRPEDAELERAFVAGLSDEARFFRFFYRLHELTPAMLARFTQIDYDRELALVAVHEADGAPCFVGVARYITNPDRESAEFAVVVADAWQGRGVAWLLMERLIDCAKRRGIKRLEGAVLRSNSNMLKFTTALGFVTRDDPETHEQVIVAKELS